MAISPIQRDKVFIRKPLSDSTIAKSLVAMGINRLDVALSLVRSLGRKVVQQLPSTFFVDIWQRETGLNASTVPNQILLGGIRGVCAIESLQDFEMLLSAFSQAAKFYCEQRSLSTQNLKALNQGEKALVSCMTTAIFLLKKIGVSIFVDIQGEKQLINAGLNNGQNNILATALLEEFARHIVRNPAPRFAGLPTTSEEIIKAIFSLPPAIPQS